MTEADDYKDRAQAVQRYTLFVGNDDEVYLTRERKHLPAKQLDLWGNV